MSRIANSSDSDRVRIVEERLLADDWAAKVKCYG
jgi:hypothetical protein